MKSFNIMQFISIFIVLVASAVAGVAGVSPGHIEPRDQSPASPGNDFDGFLQWFAQETKRTKDSNNNMKAVLTKQLAAVPIGSPDAMDDYYWLSLLDKNIDEADADYEGFKGLIDAYRKTDNGAYEKMVSDAEESQKKWIDTIQKQSGNTDAEVAAAAAASSSSAAAPASASSAVPTTPEQ